MPGNDRWVRLSRPVVWKKKSCEMIEQLVAIGWRDIIMTINNEASLPVPPFPALINLTRYCGLKRRGRKGWREGGREGNLSKSRCAMHAVCL